MKTEKVFASIFLVGLIFKLMHWPGGGPIIVISLSIIAILYFPLAFYFFCDKELKRQNLALSIISGIFLSFIPIGLMFRFQYWPGGQLYLTLGIFTAPILLAVVYLLQKKSSADLAVYYKNMLKRTTVLSTFTILIFFTPASRLIKIQHWDNPELARLKIQYFSDPGNAEYVRQYESYIMKLDSIYINRKLP